MLKKIAVIICLILICTSSAYAQEENKLLANGFSRDKWVVMTPDQKKYCIIGIHEGVKVFANTKPSMQGNEELTREIHNIFSATQTVLTPQIEYADISNEIDKFYEDENNMNIPVYKVYQLISIDEYYSKNNIGGYNKEAYVQSLRDFYNKPQVSDGQDTI